MNYALFCQILNDNLIYEFTDSVSPELREEYQQEWYIIYKEGTYWPMMQRLTDEQRVKGWMYEHFHDCSFDSHSFQLKS